MSRALVHDKVYYVKQVESRSEKKLLPAMRHTFTSLCTPRSKCLLFYDTKWPVPSVPLLTFSL
jgi:hypothetical protein